MVREGAGQIVRQQHQRNGAERWPPRPRRSAEERCDQHLERPGVVEGDAGIDIGVAQRQHCADQRHHRRRDGEAQHLDARRVDAGVARHRLVLADGAQRKAEANPAHVPAAQDGDQGDRQQRLVDAHVRHVGEDVSRHCPVELDLPPVEHLVHELGETEREDHEVHPAQPQRGKSDDEGDQEADDRGAEQGQGIGMCTCRIARA